MVNFKKIFTASVIAISFLGLTTIVSAQNPMRNSQPRSEARSGAVKHKFQTELLSGSIDKYNIEMRLTLDYDTKTVSGWYYYKSQGPDKKIKLNGKLKKEGGVVRIKMDEIVDGEVTGTFKGNFYREDQSVVGTWTSSKGKVLDFQVSK